jgi:hypothetical protein
LTLQERKRREEEARKRRDEEERKKRDEEEAYMVKDRVPQTRIDAHHKVTENLAKRRAQLMK